MGAQDRQCLVSSNLGFKFLSLLNCKLFTEIDDCFQRRLFLMGDKNDPKEEAENQRGNQDEINKSSGP